MVFSACASAHGAMDVHRVQCTSSFRFYSARASSKVLESIALCFFPPRWQHYPTRHLAQCCITTHPHILPVLTIITFASQSQQRNVKLQYGFLTLTSVVRFFNFLIFLLPLNCNTVCNESKEKCSSLNCAVSIMHKGSRFTCGKIALDVSGNRWWDDSCKQRSRREKDENDTQQMGEIGSENLWLHVVCILHAK